jgi:hypothetical protein
MDVKLVREMRSVLDAQNATKGLPALPTSMPDFIIRHIFERRNNLPLTPLPAEFLKKISKHKTAATRKAQVEKMLAGIAAEEAADTERLRLRYKNLFS